MSPQHAVKHCEIAHNYLNVGSLFHFETRFAMSGRGLGEDCVRGVPI